MKDGCLQCPYVSDMELATARIAHKCRLYTCISSTAPINDRYNYNLPQRSVRGLFSCRTALVRTGSRSTHMRAYAMHSAIRQFTSAYLHQPCPLTPHAIYYDIYIYWDFYSASYTHPPGERTLHSLYSFDKVRSHSLYKSEQKNTEWICNGLQMLQSEISI